MFNRSKHLGKKKFIHLLLVLLIVGCTESGTNKNSESQSASQNNSHSNTNNEVNYGPTSTDDPVNPEDVEDVSDDGVTYYDEEDPEEESDLPGTVFNTCGVMYKQLNNPIIFFNSDDDTVLYQMEKFSYSSAVFLSDITYKNDALQVCLEGYKDGTIVYLNSVTSQTNTSNPTRTIENDYPHELCGHIAYVNNSLNTTLNIRVEAYDYLINLSGISAPNHIPTVNSSINANNAIEGCVYSNKTSYKDTFETYKPQFDVKAFDTGALTD